MSNIEHLIDENSLNPLAIGRFLALRECTPRDELTLPQLRARKQQRNHKLKIVPVSRSRKSIGLLQEQQIPPASDIGAKLVQDGNTASDCVSIDCLSPQAVRTAADGMTACARNWMLLPPVLMHAIQTPDDICRDNIV